MISLSKEEWETRLYKLLHKPIWIFGAENDNIEQEMIDNGDWSIALNEWQGYGRLDRAKSFHHAWVNVFERKNTGSIPKFIELKAENHSTGNGKMRDELIRRLWWRYPLHLREGNKNA